MSDQSEVRNLPESKKLPSSKDERSCSRGTTLVWQQSQNDKKAFATTLSGPQFRTRTKGPRCNGRSRMGLSGATRSAPQLPGDLRRVDDRFSSIVAACYAAMLRGLAAGDPLLFPSASYRWLASSRRLLLLIQVFPVFDCCRIIPFFENSSMGATLRASKVRPFQRTVQDCEPQQHPGSSCRGRLRLRTL